MGRGRERAGRRLRGLRRLALQRASLQHRAAAQAEPRVARLARAHGGEARRGAGPDPRVTDGIHRIPVPTPFAVGRVNVYLIEDEPLTLVDAGPNSATSYNELTNGLAALGHSLEDIERGILPHQHIAHLGLVSLVAERSGADVAAIDVAVPFVENYSEEAQKDDEFARSVMLRNGIPADVVSALSAVSQAFRAWGARADVTRVLHDGDS